MASSPPARRRRRSAGRPSRGRAGRTGAPAAPPCAGPRVRTHRGGRWVRPAPVAFVPPPPCSLLARCSFEVRYQTYYFAPLTLPVLVLRSLPHRVHPRPAATVEQTAARQHVPSPLLRRAMDALLAPELARIRAGRSVPIGTSCLA